MGAALPSQPQRDDDDGPGSQQEIGSSSRKDGFLGRGLWYPKPIGTASCELGPIETTGPTGGTQNTEHRPQYWVAWVMQVMASSFKSKLRMIMLTYIVPTLSISKVKLPIYILNLGC